MGRRQEIVAIVRSTGFASVASLAQRFNVDSSTIRRDLDRLAQQRLIERTHGGAVAPRSADGRTSSETRHRAEKAAIGAAMAERIHEGQTVLLDSGTTTLEVARHLKHQRLTVVTHDLRIGLEIAKRRSMHLVFIGGELLPQEFAMWGPMSVQQIDTMRVNVAIFGADTVLDEGLYIRASYELEVKRHMRAIAAEAFFVADSSKFGREALFKVFGFEAFTAGITDDTLDPIRAASFPVPLIRVPARRTPDADTDLDDSAVGSERGRQVMRPGSRAGSDSTEGWGPASTEEVSPRAARAGDAAGQ